MEPLPFREAFSVGRGVSNGIAAVRRAPWPLLVGGFLMQCTEGGGSGGGGGGGKGDGGWSGDGSDGEAWDLLRVGGGIDLHSIRSAFPFEDLGGLELGIIAIIVVIVLIVFLAVFAFRCWLHTGWIRLHQAVLETGSTSFAPLWSGRDRFTDMLLWKLLAGLVGLGTAVVAMVPGGALCAWGIASTERTLVIVGVVLLIAILLPVAIWVGLGLALGQHAVALDGMSPTDALQRSWELASGNRWPLFVYLLVMVLLRVAGFIAGVLLCCVGLFVTLPAARAAGDVAVTEAYLLATRSRDATAALGTFGVVT